MRKSCPPSSIGVPKSASALMKTTSAPAVIDGVTTGIVTVKKRRSLPLPRFSAHSSSELSMLSIAPEVYR